MAIDAQKLASLASTGKAKHDFIDIPRVYQEAGYSCGAAALLAVLRYNGIAIENEQDLYGKLKTTPKQGTAPQEIVRVANEYGLQANFRTDVTLDDITDAANEGVPVLLDIQAWEEEPEEPDQHIEDGHYVVLMGVADDEIHYMDPSSGEYESMPFDELQQRWHDVDGPNGAIFIEGEQK